MQIGNAWLKLDSSGSNVQLTEITPAEAAVLNVDHETNAHGVAVHDVVWVKDVERTGEVEINRLKEKYANARNKKGDQWAEVLYPGKNPVLPQTFKDIGLEITGAPAAKAAPTLSTPKPNA